MQSKEFVEVQKNIWGGTIKENIQTALGLIPGIITKHSETIDNVFKRFREEKRVLHSRKERDFTQDLLKIKASFKSYTDSLEVLPTISDENIKSSQTEDMLNNFIDICDIYERLMRSSKFYDCFGYRIEADTVKNILSWKKISGAIK